MLRPTLATLALALVCALPTQAEAIMVEVTGSYGPINPGSALAVTGTYTLTGGETSFLFGFFLIGGVNANATETFAGSGILTGTFTAGSLSGLAGTTQSVSLFGLSNTFGADFDAGPSLQINPVPEPSTFLLAGVGLVAAAVRRRRLTSQLPEDELTPEPT